MPRLSTNRKDEAKYLVHVRNLLGLSQRQLAVELKVTHGAVSQWESGERSIPGPVLRLLEIYEENLGMVDQPKHRSMKKLNSTWISRTAKISVTAAKIAARLAKSSLRQIAVGNEKSASLKEATQEVIGQQVTDAFSELKGLSMKLGQMLSYLDFALPKHMKKQLASLQDSGVPIDSEIVEKIIESELGTPVHELFKPWYPKPIASASIGQVHRARLRDGTYVAVKVQHPKITDVIQADIRSLSALDTLSAFLYRSQEKGIFIEEVRERLLEECDYKTEASNLETFSRLYGGHPTIRIPNVYKELSSAKILTMEMMPGLRFSEFVRSSSQEQKNNAGKLIFEMSFGSIFKHHIFNCDPHPGNYLFNNDQVVFLDFGCVRRFDSSFIDLWRRYVRSILEQDRKLQDELVVEIGHAKDLDKFNFDYNAHMMKVLYEPFLTDEPFRFNRHFVKETWRTLITDNSNIYFSNLPKEWMFTNRLHWGLYSVLAELEAKANWREIFLEFLYNDNEIRPFKSKQMSNSLEG